MPVMTAIAGPLSPRRASSAWSPFLQQAEQAVLLASGAGDADLVVAGH
jgi:hypothetical protein